MKNKIILAKLTEQEITKPPRVLGSIWIPPVHDFSIPKSYRPSAQNGFTVDYDYYFTQKIRGPLLGENISVKNATQFEAIQVFQDMYDGHIAKILNKPNSIDVKPFLAILFNLMLDRTNNNFGKRGLSLVNANIFKVDLGDSSFASITAFWFEGRKQWYITSEKYSPLIVRHRGNILYSLCS